MASRTALPSTPETLRRQIEDQGFRVEVTGEGFVVFGDPALPNDGVVRIHNSAWKSNKTTAQHSIMNACKIGFDPGRGQPPRSNLINRGTGGPSLTEG
jgi:hypothetical protein